MMKFQFLGTSAATSLPLVFCRCAVCKASRQAGGKNIRKRASALIDLGPDLCSQAELCKVDLGEIRYLLQTHSHSDHFDAGHLITRSRAYGTEALQHLDIVCSRGTARDMNRWIQLNEASFDLGQAKWKADMQYDLHLLQSGDRILLRDYEIIALDAGHDAEIEALVYIIGRAGKYVLYGTDLGHISAKAWEILGRYSLHLVVLDQTYGKDMGDSGHFSGRQVRETVQHMLCRNIIDQNTPVYATHISHEGNAVHDTMVRASAQNGYSIAYDGLTLFP